MLYAHESVLIFNFSCVCAGVHVHAYVVQDNLFHCEEAYPKL
jgi:hypothetical protein